MTRTRTALIIGGGIAGPATATALQKAGIEPTVYESRPTVPTTSACSSRSPPECGGTPAALGNSGASL
jgi:2-polyprenyl-6-methoxyphenol hydroxylase-like FAD-dependent oxidoreductase